MSAIGSYQDFWELRHPPGALAVVEGRSGLQRSYGQLSCDATAAAAALPQAIEPSLHLLLARNRYECLVAYVAVLRTGQPLILCDATLNATLLGGVIERYRPEFIWSADPELPLPGYRALSSDPPSICERVERQAEAPSNPALALMLSTSGSTGSPKMVRLTHANLQANATSIADSLALSKHERPITSLPMAYAYGLSVLNSHLLVGATLVLSEDGVLQREFWDVVDAYECTSFSGVPYSYQMLLQTALLERRGKSLRTFTQAGGRLAEPSVQRLHRLVTSRGSRLIVMYGQTEATARISYVPADMLESKVGSVGVAIPGGTISLADNAELLYRGPNVMMGYAETRADLALGDELHGLLRTGDLARMDGDGYFFITGRLRRFLKLFGKRYNLDEIELVLQRGLGVPVACFGHDDQLTVALEGADVSSAATLLRQTFALPRDVVRIVPLPSLPRTLNGKINYRGLEEAPQA